MYYLSCCDWLISLSLMISRFIHVIAYIKISFLFKVEPYSIVCAYHSLFIHSTVDGNSGRFHLWALVNNVAMNMVYDFKSLLSVLSGTPLEEALLGLPFIIS